MNIAFIVMLIIAPVVVVPDRQVLQWFASFFKSNKTIYVFRKMEPAAAKARQRHLFFQKFPDRSKEPQRHFLRTELSSFDGEAGRPLYLIVENSVYDVTHFVAHHPGGPQHIRQHAGRDASAAMRATTMPGDVYVHLQRFRVGRIVEEPASTASSVSLSTTQSSDPADHDTSMSDSKYTRAEVATRNGKAGAAAWIIYKDYIYDVTNYANEHPGGKSEIMEEAGGDSTKAFDSSGHSSDARTIMAKYRIGEIVEEEKYYDQNGKKKKKIVSAQPEGSSKSCLSVVTCGLVG